MNKTDWICMLSFFLLAFSYSSVYGQEQLGLRLENHSGIYGVVLNPANSLTIPHDWEVNLGAANFYGDSNIAFIRNTNIINILKKLKNGSPVNHSIDRDINDLPSNSITFDLIVGEEEKYGSIFTSIMGPSLLIKLNDRHSIGLLTRARMAVSSLNASNIFKYYEISQLNGQFVKASPIDIAGAAWTEVGLNYSYQTETYNGKLSIGVTAKYLGGYEALFIEVPYTFAFRHTSVDTLDFSNTVVNFGYTTTNTNFNNVDPNFSNNGQGIGIDIGAVITIGYYDDPQEYDWKLGVSIIDMGNITFNRNTQLHKIAPDQDSFGDILSIPYNDYIEFLNFNTIAQNFSELTTGNPTASKVGNKFTVGLPTALVLQADYYALPNFYVNGTLVQKIKLNTQTIGRNNIFSITPRYETKWFSVSLPFVVQNYKKARLGFAGRLAFLTIGTDYLGSFVGKRNLTGTDFYVGAKINFSNGEHSIFNRGGGRVKCYEF